MKDGYHGITDGREWFDADHGLIEKYHGITDDFPGR